MNLPKECPSCGSELEWNETNIDLFCLNPLCPSQVLYKIEYFLRTLGVEEMSATTIEKFNLSSIEDVYSLLNEEYIMSLDGFQESRTTTILAQVSNSIKDVAVEKLIAAFGIPGLGTRNAEKMIEYFRQENDELEPEQAMNLFFETSPDEFLLIDGFGVKSAEKIRDLRDPFKDLYNFLIDEGLSFAEFKEGILSGHSIAMTGNASNGMKRPVIEKLIEQHGGKNGGVSKKTTILVCKDPSGNSGKLKKARENFEKNGQPKIMSYEEFFVMIGR